jgi:hypothetical protein
MSLLFPTSPDLPPLGGRVPLEHPFDLETDGDGIDLFAEEAPETSSPEILAIPCGNTLSTVLCDCLETVSTIFCYGCGAGETGCSGCSDGGCSDGGCGGCGGDSDGGGCGGGGGCDGDTGGDTGGDAI